MRAEALITETLKLEETRFRKTLERGLSPARRCHADARQGRHARRRDRLQALRHLWLPARPDAGRAARSAASASISTGFTRRHGAPEGRGARAAGPAPARRRPRRSGSRSARQRGATEFLGYDTETAEGVVPGDRQGRRRRSRAVGRRQGAGRRQPDAVLRRVRRPDGRYRRRSLDRRRSTSPTRRRRPTACSSISATVDRGHAQGRRRRRARRRPCAPHAAARQPLGDPPPASRRCARCWAPMSRRRARWSRPSGLRFDVSHPKPISAEELESSRRWPTRSSLQNTPVTTRLMSVDDAIAEGAMALFGEKYGDEVRVVSMGTGACDEVPEQALFGRALRRHPCPAHRRHRPGAHRRRKRGRRRRAPYRGADRRVRRANISTSRTSALKAVAASLKVRPGRRAGPRRGAGGRAPQARARTGRGRAGSWRMRRRCRTARPMGPRRSPASGFLGKPVTGVDAEGSARASPTTGKTSARLGRRRLRRRFRGRQGERGGRRHRRSDAAVQRGRSGARRLRRARRPGRRRPARHGAGQA